MVEVSAYDSRVQRAVPLSIPFTPESKLAEVAPCQSTRKTQTYA